jgi:hypothetical protein
LSKPKKYFRKTIHYPREMAQLTLRFNKAFTKLLVMTNNSPLRNTQYAIRNTQYAIRNTQYAIRNTQYAIRNTQYAIRNTQYAIRLRSAQWCVQFEEINN